MKKLFSVLIAFTLLYAGPVSAQNLTKAGRPVVETITSKSAPKTPSGVNRILSNIQTTARKIFRFNKLAPTKPVPTNKGPNKVIRPLSPSNRELNEKIALQKKALEQNKSVRKPVVASPIGQVHMRNFQAFMPNQPGTRFSGTVFEVEYNGKKEIYGAVASHILAANDGGGNNIQKTFSTLFYDNGRPIEVPAKVVTVSAPALLDISLVQFPAEYEKILKPYSLGKMSSEKSVQACGFNHGGAVYMTSCGIQKNLPYSIHINIPLAREERPGLCGSAVLNEKQELVGIVVGSTIAPWVNPDRTFVTPAVYLRNLVEAFHHNGQSAVSFLLYGTHAISLNVDEYVTRVVLLDAQRQQLYRYNVKERFSRTDMGEALKAFPQTRYLEVVAQKIRWSQDGSTLLKKKDHNFPPTAYLYDLQTDQVISSREVQVVLPI